MKTLIQLMVVALAGVIIATLHPFQLAMPWQTGSVVEAESTLFDIMSGYRFERTEIEVGGPTPFNYNAAAAVYRARGNPAETCTDLRLTLDDWGVVVDIVRMEGGCDIEANGPGPMTATISVAEEPETSRDLRIDVRVQHTP